MIKGVKTIALCALVLAARGFSAAAPEAGYELAYSDTFDKGTDHFEFTDAKAWKVAEDGSNKVLSLCGESGYEPKVRSPKCIARLKDFAGEDVIIDVKVRQTGREYGHRDACIFFGYTDPSKFYYVHLATTADDHANSIFLVNDAPRVSIAKERTKGTDWSTGFHHLRVKREGSTGKIEVYFDDMKTPVMRAEDKSFTKGAIGLGSFDDTADFDDLAVYVKKK